QGLVMGSPFLGPALTLDVLGEPWRGQHRWNIDLIALAWCLLAWAFTGALYWATLRSFDRRLGRMRETSRSRGPDAAARFDDPGSGELALAMSADAASPGLAGGDEGCQNEDR